MPRGQAEQLTAAICLSTHFGLKSQKVFFFIADSICSPFPSVCLTMDSAWDTWLTWQDTSRSCASDQRWSATDLCCSDCIRPGPSLKSSAHSVHSLWFLFHSRMMTKQAQCQLARLKLFTQIRLQSAVWQLDTGQHKTEPTGVYLPARWWLSHSNIHWISLGIFILHQHTF